MKKNIPAAQLYRILNPGPLVLVSARHDGRNHICTVAWNAPLDAEKPKALLVLSAEHATTRAIAATGELVINVPGAELADEALGIGSLSGVRVDKFAHFHLTPVPCKKVKAPAIGECAAWLECRVLERQSALGRQLAQKYDVLIVEILGGKAESRLFDGRWRPEKGATLLHHLGGRDFMLSGKLRPGKTRR